MTNFVPFAYSMQSTRPEELVGDVRDVKNFAPLICREKKTKRSEPTPVMVSAKSIRKSTRNRLKSKKSKIALELRL